MASASSSHPSRHVLVDLGGMGEILGDHREDIAKVQGVIRRDDLTGR